MKRHYPLFVDVEGRLCLVVGGGRVAEERVRKLVDHGAVVRLVSPQLTPRLDDMVMSDLIPELRRRTYVPSDLDGCLLAVAATDAPVVNQAVATDARARGVLCNVVDDPSRGDVIVPSLVRRGDLAVAITTGGASPAVASHVRAELERVFGPEWDQLLDMLREVRGALKERYPDSTQRSSVVRSLFDSPVLPLFADGRDAEARCAAREILQVEVAGCA
jgi:precorrin-2 dehydrogenase / sirohydrochlorin ferrochelatase